MFWKIYIQLNNISLLKGNMSLVFVTGQGRAGFHLSGPAPAWVRGGCFWRNPSPAPVRGLPTLIPWTGPRFSPPIFNRGPSGVWAGQGPWRRQGWGMPKNMPRPGPSSTVGRRKGPVPRVFQGPVFFRAPDSP